ncbi:MAG: C25 family cysteine peptidase [candidate division WOR-3 bacterium]|nr:C25 family cysteine peptidase [candidate division WOR-3 bacterium]
MRKVLLCFVIPLLALAGTMTQTFTFSPEEVKFTEADGYDVPDLRGYVSTSAPGEPIIPQAIVTFVVPSNATVTNVEVVNSEKTELPGTYDIYPTQTPRPLSVTTQPEFVGPDPAVYGSSAEYPGKLVEFGYTGTKTGYRLCGVSAYPLQYSPATGKATLYTSLTLKVTYQENSYAATPMTRTQIDVAAAELRSFVANVSGISKFAPALRQTDPTDAEYVIITSDDYISTLQPLADWLSRKGFTTVFKTVSWIMSTYPGYDAQETIRNFVIDYYANHGTMWVLLAGAHSVIPARRGRSVVNSEAGNIPADLYYADLQWSWDGNGNHIYGEAGGDTVDFYADVYVGRAPINSVANAQTLVNKVFGYEKAPNTDYIKKAYLPWVNLFSGYTGKVVSDTIAGITPSDWTDTEVSAPSPSAFQSAINTGYGVCHGAAHGDDYGFYTDQGIAIYTTSEAAAQTNGMDKLVIMNSMACISGNFERQNCLSVTLQNNANGGSVANMLNSRYGWGTPPSMGPSERLCVRFYDFFIQKDSWLLGVAHARGKDVYASLPQTQEVWRWCFYDYNLMGEPAMPVWSDVPGTLAIAVPDSVPTGTSSLHVNVASGGNPVSGAWVGLYKSGDICTRAKTNSSGNVDITIAPSTPGWLYVTAYAQDKLAVTDSVRVYTGTPMPYIDLQGYYVDDGGNHQLDPGETVDLYVTLRNIGSEQATDVQGLLSEGSTYITVPDSNSAYGTMSAGDTSRGDRYQLTAAGNTPPGSQIQFTCHVTSDQGSWDPTFTLYVGVPPTPGAVVMTHDTGYCRLAVTALGSIGYDAPPSLDAGIGFCYPKAAATELYYSSLALGNGASYLVDRYYGNPATNYNTDFHIEDSLWAIFPPGSGDEHFRCVINDGGHAAPKSITVAQNSFMTAASGYDDFAVLVYDIHNGGAGAADGLYAGVFADFDIGSDPATNQAAADTVRRTMSMRQASGDNPTVGVKILDPVSFANLSAVDHNLYVYPQDTAMTDDMKYRFLNGTIVQRNSNRDYDWSICASVGPFDLAAGETYKCAFAFVGGISAANFAENADSAQSWYDNLLGVSGREGVALARDAARVACVPNPFSRSVQIRYNVPVAGRVRAQVFDVSGRSVAILADGEMAAGKVETVWKPGNLANGVYLLKVVLPNGTASEKLMLLR